MEDLENKMGLDLVTKLHTEILFSRDNKGLHPEEIIKRYCESFYTNPESLTPSLKEEIQKILDKYSKQNK